MARYSDFLYSSREYGQRPRGYALSFLEAKALDYGSVQVTVNAPERFGVPYVVVRSANGAAEDPTDGLAIASGRVDTAQFLIDDSPQPGMVYYTLFVFDDDGRWLKDAATSVLSPEDRRGYIKTLQTVPRMFLDDTLNPLTPFEPNSFMARYLYGVALTVDELGTYTDLTLPESRSNQGVRRMSHAWASGLGFQPETEIGTAASYREHRDVGLINTKKGLPQGLVAYVEALTGWSVSLSRYENLLPTVDDASFEEGSGGWHFPDADFFIMQFQDVEAVDIEDEDLQIGDLRLKGSLVYDLPYDYPLSPFAKQGAGMFVMNEDLVTLTLPGPDVPVTDLIPAQEFRLYVFKAPVISDNGDTTVTPAIVWYDHRGEYISETAGEPLEVSEGGGYVVVVVDDQAPQGTRFMRPSLTLAGEAGNRVILDRLSLMDADGPYRDPNSVTIICSPDRVNLLSDASFEFDGFWTSTEGTFEATEEAAIRGYIGGRAFGTPYEIHSESIPALPGFSLTLSATAHGEGTASLGFRYFDESGAQFEEQTETMVLGTSPSEFNMVSIVPEGAGALQIMVKGSGTINLDLMTLDRQERPQVYFDGNHSHVDQDDSNYVIDSEHIYSVLYNNRLLKLVRLRESLKNYLPIGVTPRIVFWDSWDDEVRALVPYGVDLNAVPPDAPQNLFVLPGDERIFVQFYPGETELSILNYSYSVDGGETWVDRLPESDATEFTILGVPETPSGTERRRLYSELEGVEDYAALSAQYEDYFDLSGRVEVPLTSLQNGQKYFVRIRGLTADGYTSPSAVAVVVPRRPPNAPVVTVVEPLSESVRISFLEPDGNGAPVDSYQYSFDDGETWSPLYQGSSPLLLEDLTNGTTYSLLLRANNDEGSGPGSLPIVFTPRTVPGAPVLTSLTPGDRTILVAFDPPVFDGGAPILNYELSLDGGDHWTALSEEISSSPFLVQDLVNGTTYALALRAVNVAGKSEPSNVLEATPRTVPGAPNITSVSASDQALTVAFAITDDGGSAVTNIDYSVDDGSTWTTRNPADPDSPLFISGLTNGVDYLIRVRATNVAGTGPASNQGRGRPFTRPNPPQNLEAAPDDELVTLTWDPPLSDGGMPIAYYLVTVQPAEGVITYPIDRTGTGAVITELRNGVEYLFTVTATNTGNSTGDAASVKAIPRTVPDAPTNLQATRAVESIPLTWTAPYNGGSPITTYKVRYSADLGTSWAPAQTTGSAATSFTVEDLEPGIDYIFQVRATNVAGDGPWSEPTGPISPWAVPGPPRNLQLTPGDRRVDATWLPPLNLALTSVTGYIVEYSVTAGVWVRVGTTPDLSQQIFGLRNGVPVNVRVAATGLAGQSSWVVAGPVTPAGLPTATITGASSGDSGGTVFFTTDGNGAAVTKVQYSATTTVRTYNWQDFSPSISSSPGRISGLTNGTRYYVVVRAQNSVGFGPPSNTVTISPTGVVSEPAVAGPNIVDISFSTSGGGGYVTNATLTTLYGPNTADWPPGVEIVSTPGQDPVWAILRTPAVTVSSGVVVFEWPLGGQPSNLQGFDISWNGGGGQRPDVSLRQQTALGQVAVFGGFIDPNNPTAGTFAYLPAQGSSQASIKVGGVGSSLNGLIPLGSFVRLRAVTSAGSGPWGEGFWYGGLPGGITVAAPNVQGLSRVSFAPPPESSRGWVQYDVEVALDSGYFRISPSITKAANEVSFFLSAGLSSRWQTIKIRVRARGQWGTGRWRYYP